MPDWVGGTYYNRCDQRDFSVQVGPPEHAMKEEPYKYFYRLASGYTILSRNHRSEYVVTDYSPRATEPRIGEYNPPVKADDLMTFLFMLFARVSMHRVWSLYYMLQVMSNLINYLPLLIPGNALTFVKTIKNVACFMFFRNADVQRFVN